MEMSSASLAQRTTRSAAWLFFQKFATSLISLVAVAILARALEPAVFGIVAISETLLRLAVAFGQGTVGNYVIYDRGEGWQERARAAFWLNLAIVGGIIALFILVMPVITSFYEEPLLQPVLFAVLLKFGVNQLRAVPDALVKRSLDYSKLVLRDTSLMIISSLLSIWMALTGYGVWSLVVPGIVIAVPQVILVMWMAKWVPTLPLGIKHWGKIFRYTGYIIADRVLGILTTDGDTLVIGKLIGAAGLGIYDRAWRTANLVTNNITFVVSDLALPSLSSISHRAEAFQRTYLKMLRMLSIFSFPLLAWFFVMAEEIILTVYGQKWVESVTPLRIFILYTLQRSVGSPVGSVYNAKGRPDLGFKINIVLLPIYFTAIYLGGFYGLIGISVLVTLVKTVSGFVAIYFACRLLELDYRKALASLWPAAEFSLIIAIGMVSVKAVLVWVGITASGAILVINATVGVLLGLGLLLTRYQRLLEEILTISDNMSIRIGLFVRRVLRRPLAQPVSSSSTGSE